MRIYLSWLIPLACSSCTLGGSYPTARTAVNRGPVQVEERGVVVTLRPVDDSNLRLFPSLQTRIAGQESVPLVPLPSFEVQIDNHTAKELSFDAGGMTVTDDSGREIPAFSDVEQYVSRVVDRLAPGAGAAQGLREAAGRVPLFRPSLRVPPGQSWTGALVVDTQARSPEELARLTTGHLRVRTPGMRLGTRTLESKEFVFALDGRSDHVACSDGQRARAPADCTRIDGFDQWVPDGPCLQLGSPSSSASYRERGRWRTRWIGGTRVTNSEVDDALLSVTASRAAAKGARRLRISGYSLIAAGLFGAAGSAAGIAGAGHPWEAPAGLSMLALTGVGALLNYYGHKRELDAVREYNQFAFTTGACSPSLR